MNVSENLVPAITSIRLYVVAMCVSKYLAPKKFISICFEILNHYHLRCLMYLLIPVPLNTLSPAT